MPLRFMVEARLRVIYGDTDQMGVVYYANYFRYFELARSEYFRSKGGSYRDLEKEGALLPVVEATASYRASARYDDVLVVRTTVTEIRRASLTFSYELLRDGESQILCTGKTVHACVGRDGRPTRLPETIVTLLREGASTPAAKT
jgi:acyl-CoA thioester hydrolase